MGEETLSPEELNALLDGAEIISDDTGKYETVSAEEKAYEEKIEEPDREVDPVIETAETAEKKQKAPDIPDDVVEVKSLTFQQKHNAELLLDIFVSVTVELGRTSIKIKDVLGLGEGSIVELQKPASEPVDLLVNNRLIARGEVVVIDENFGARVTNIVNPLEKLKN